MRLPRRLIGIVVPASFVPLVLASFASAPAQEGAKRPDDRPAARGEPVYCDVRGGSTIIKLAPNGSRVRRGDVVCELNEIVLRDSLKNQQIAAAQAEADYQLARSARQGEEMALEEYEATAKAELAGLTGAINLAKAEVDLAKAERDRAKRLDRPMPGERSLVREDLAVVKAQFALEQLEAKSVILTKYTKGRRLRELCVAIGRAKGEELVRKSRSALEQDKVRLLERQVPLCRLVAPIDGAVALGSGPPAIEEGANVRERQIILRVIPDGAAGK